MKKQTDRKERTAD